MTIIILLRHTPNTHKHGTVNNIHIHVQADSYSGFKVICLNTAVVRIPIEGVTERNAQSDL